MLQKPSDRSQCWAHEFSQKFYQRKSSLGMFIICALYKIGIDGKYLYYVIFIDSFWQYIPELEGVHIYSSLSFIHFIPGRKKR